MDNRSVVWATVAVAFACISLTLSSVNILVIKPLETNLSEAEASIEEALNTCPPNQFCYEPQDAPVEPEYNLTGTFVGIHWLPEDKMPEDTLAYAQWEVDFDKNISVCYIRATLPERITNDPRMDALGHEFLHCLTGQFHP